MAISAFLILDRTTASQFLRFLEEVANTEFKLGYSMNSKKIAFVVFLESSVKISVSIEKPEDLPCSFPLNGSLMEKKMISAEKLAEALNYRFANPSLSFFLESAINGASFLMEEEDLPNLAINLPCKRCANDLPEDFLPVAQLDFQSFHHELVSLAEQTNHEPIHSKWVNLKADLVSKSLGIINLEIFERESRYSLKGRLGIRFKQMSALLPFNVDLNFHTLLKFVQWGAVWGARSVFLSGSEASSWKLQATIEEFNPLDVDIQMIGDL